MEKVGEFWRKVEPFSEDATKHLSLSLLGSQLLRLAGLHASSCGYGYEHLQKTNSVWVLSRMTMLLKHRPQVLEKYGVRTWVDRCYRQFCDRLYTLTDEQERVIGRVFTVWSVIDYSSRSSVDLQTLGDGRFDQYVYEDASFPKIVPARIRLKEANKVGQHKVGFTDLDINGHVNSMKYVDMMMNIFSYDYLKCHEPVRIDLQYANESYYGESLDLYRREMSVDCFHIEVRRGDEVLVRGAFEFEPLENNSK